MKKNVLFLSVIASTILLPYQSAWATIITLNICNKGTIPAYIAVARNNYEKTHLTGWYETKPGKCAVVVEARSNHYYLSFSVKGGFLNFDTNKLSYSFKPGNQAFCVSKKKSFNYYEGNKRRLLCKSGFELAPFWMHLHFNIPTKYSSYGQENKLIQTIDISPSKDSFIIKSEMVPRMMEARKDYVDSILTAINEKNTRISKVIWNGILNFDKGIFNNLVKDHQVNSSKENMSFHRDKIKITRPDKSKRNEHKYVEAILQKLKNK